MLAHTLRPEFRRLMQDFEQLDFYELLGVARNASLDEIKRAYRQQMARYHPDRFAGAPEDERIYASQRAQRINEAYRVLSDLNTRHAYSRNNPSPGLFRRPNSESTTAFRPPTQPRDHQAELYEQARVHLDAGRYLQAAATLRQLQQINPFYRDSATLLAQAEDAIRDRMAGSSRREGAAVGAGTSRRPGFLRRLVVLGGIGGITLAGLVIAFGLWFRQGQIAGDNNTVAALQPTAITVPTAAPAEPTSLPTPQPTSAPEPTATAPPPTAVPTTPPPTAAPTAPPAEPTAIAPTPVPESLAERGTLLFADDFRVPRGWAITQGRTWNVGYFEGAYQINIQKGTGNIWSFNTAPGGPDFGLGADVRVRGGAAGLLLRYFDMNNYLAFFVDPVAGSYQLEQRSGGRISIIAEGAVVAVKTGEDATNRLVAQMRGNQIILFVNGVSVAEVTVNQGANSQMYGMIAVARDMDAVALFNKMEVRALDQ